MTSLSFVVPVYNRKKKLLKALDSIIPVCSTFSVEVIIVDDCSSDGLCMEFINEHHLASTYDSLKYIKLPVNMGVTFAKNVGGLGASGNWIVFLDSDDTLTLAFPDALGSLLDLFKGYESCPDAIFFRSISSSTKRLVGSYATQHYLSLDEYLKEGTYGECLPVIKRQVFNQYPYNPSFRGCESWSYLHILLNGKTLYLSDKITRAYDDHSSDRLSSNLNILSRSFMLSRYHAGFFLLLLRRAKIFWFGSLVKSLCYFVCALFWSIGRVLFFPLYLLR